MEKQQNELECQNIYSCQEFPHIPQEAFLFFPDEQQIKSGKEKNQNRLIYEGQIQLSEWELSQLAILEQKIKDKKIILSTWWNNPRKLRFLQANHFKYGKAIKSMLLHQNWRYQNLPIQSDNNIVNQLNRGIFYVHGRDHKYRPIMVFDVSKISIKQLKMNEFLSSLTYMLEYVLNNLLLPGQIENWIAVIDLKHIGLTGLPINMLKQMMGYFQNNYRSRVFKIYVLNAVGAITIPWSIIKNFLEDVTIQKVSFYGNSIPKPLFDHCNKEQMEIKYGGTAPDLTSDYWPPREINSKYLKEENSIPNKSRIFSQQQYYTMFKENQLQNNVVCLEQLISPTVTQAIFAQVFPTKVSQNDSINNNNGSDNLNSQNSDIRLQVTQYFHTNPFKKEHIEKEIENEFRKLQSVCQSQTQNITSNTNGNNTNAIINNLSCKSNNGSNNNNFDANYNDYLIKSSQLQNVEASYNYQSIILQQQTSLIQIVPLFKINPNNLSQR